MAVKNLYKMMIICCNFIVSQSWFRWDVKTPIFYGQNVTLSCNGNDCSPFSIRKWIGGPSYDVLCFDNYTSNPAKYEMIYNKTTPSFELMIKSFNFNDTNCEYTCACGFHQYTNMLKLKEIQFVYPPDKDLESETEQIDGKLYINMSMKIYPLPNCTISYGNIVLPVETEIIDEQEKVGINLYRLKLQYIVDVEYKNCRENLLLSCEVRSFGFPLLQLKLDLCKDHPNVKPWMYIVGIVFLSCLCFVSILLMTIVVVRRQKESSMNPELIAAEFQQQIDDKE